MVSPERIWPLAPEVVRMSPTTLRISGAWAAMGALVSTMKKVKRLEEYGRFLRPKEKRAGYASAMGGRRITNRRIGT